MINQKIVQLIFRSVVIFVWSALIAGLLYISPIMHWFYQKKSINMLVWGAVLDKEFIKEFEDETGIYVNMSYFENNEELFVKLQSTDKHDYDIIMPSEWAVELMIQQGLIKKLDKTRIQVWNTLYPTLLNHYFDPGNHYSVPFYWSLFGIGINNDYFKGKAVQSWGLVFDELIMPPRISMVEDPRHLTLIAALYLFGTVDNLQQQQIDAIKQLLLKQKSHVEVYTDLRPEYVLASGVVPVVVGLFADLLKIMRRMDNIDFVVPQEGVFINIDSFVIPATSRKDDLIYPFLNYLCKAETVAKYVDKFDFFPATQVVTREYDERFAQLTTPTQELFNKVIFFKNIISKDLLNDILITLKS